MIGIDRLQKLVRPKNAGGADWTYSPFRVEIEREKYIGATNGHALVVVRGDEPALAEMPAGAARVAFPEPLEWKEGLFKAFQGWAVRDRKPGPFLCACAGKNAYCVECEGSGKIPEAYRAGRILGVTFDRNLLADFTEGLDAFLVEFGLRMAARHLVVQCPQWRISVMGMRVGTDEGPEFEGWA